MSHTFPRCRHYCFPFQSGLDPSSLTQALIRACRVSLTVVLCDLALVALWLAIESLDRVETLRPRV